MVSRNGTSTTSTSSDDTTGGSRADCRWEAPGAREKAMACVDLARKLWKENAEELKASKAVGPAHPAARAQHVTPQKHFYSTKCAKRTSAGRA